jgi:WD40 repeat protein
MGRLLRSSPDAVRYLGTRVRALPVEPSPPVPPLVARLVAELDDPRPAVRQNAADEDGTVQAWALATGKTLGVYPGPPGDISGFALPPDGRILAWGSDGVALYARDILTGNLLGPSVSRHPAAAVAFSPGGRILASADTGGRVFRWNVDAGAIGLGAPPPSRGRDSLTGPKD